MPGCPQGRFTSRVDFEFRAPQIAANAVAAAAASKTFTVTLNKNVTAGSRRLPHLHAYLAPCLTFKLTLRLALPSCLPCTLPYFHACLAACLTFMLALRTGRFEYASCIKQSTRESLSTLVQKGS
jgi:hypothetical protein